MRKTPEPWMALPVMAGLIFALLIVDVVLIGLLLYAVVNGHVHFAWLVSTAVDCMPH